jgi:hypothetical protein
METMRIFLALLFVSVSPAMASPVVGKTYTFKSIDVDGGTLTTSEHIVTVLVFSVRANLDKVRQVGDRIPERCLGNPKYRMITVIEFPNTRNRLMQYLLSSSVRHGLDLEAKRLRTRYAAKGVSRDPRGDVHAIADFNGQTAVQLDLQPSTQFEVLVLAANGGLISDWTTVPTAEQLSAALP